MLSTNHSGSCVVETGSEDRAGDGEQHQRQGESSESTQEEDGSSQGQTGFQLRSLFLVLCVQVLAC